MNAKMNDACSSFASSFCNAFSAALTQACNFSWQVTSLKECAEGDSGAPTSDHYKITFGSPAAGQCVLSFQSAETGAETSKRLTGEGGIIEAALDGTVARLKNLLRPEHRDMKLTVEAVKDSTEPAPASMLSTRLVSEGSTIDLRLAFDAPLIAALSQPALHPLFIGEADGNEPQPNLDMVMDVALNVTLRFGRRQLPLREIIDLASGSVVELDRQVDEPIELVLDGRVVARGEAVIIDGNYGMRVTQIVQPFLNA
jgi:flagellar motor switch protein FliN/FliY